MGNSVSTNRPTNQSTNQPRSSDGVSANGPGTHSAAHTWLSVRRSWTPRVPCREVPRCFRLSRSLHGAERRRTRAARVMCAPAAVALLPVCLDLGFRSGRPLLRRSHSPLPLGTIHTHQHLRIHSHAANMSKGAFICVIPLMLSACTLGLVAQQLQRAIEADRHHAHGLDVLVAIVAHQLLPHTQLLG